MQVFATHYNITEIRKGEECKSVESAKAFIEKMKTDEAFKNRVTIAESAFALIRERVYSMRVYIPEFGE